MKIADFKDQVTTTPAFVVDEEQVLQNLKPLQRLREASGCRILYAIKALPLASVLRLLKGELDGFAVSSLFEAKLAAEVTAGQGSLHLTSPGLRADEFSELAALCSHISFNSLSQYGRLSLTDGYAPGLRINPQLSVVDDPRYDPCRQHSKLGVAVDVLNDDWPDGIEGLHLHNAFGQHHYAPLLASLQRIKPLLDKHNSLSWLNLGGGYLHHSIDDQQALIAAIVELRRQHELDVYVEPGKSLVGNAGYLVTSILDRFVSEGKWVLVLDTSVNHHPEVFEYQRSPQLLEHIPDGRESALLVGGSCLAGDVFGEYHFDELPKVGERVVFAEVGAYSLIKANRFNGHNLPDVYHLKESCSELVKGFNYQDFQRHWL